MIKAEIRSFLIMFVILIFSACQSLVQAPTPTQPAATHTATSQPATAIPIATPTNPSVSSASLAGLIVSSPILGSPHEIPGVEPPEMVTPNGLGIISAEGKLIKFADVGVFESISPSGAQIVYQHGFENEMTDYVDDLYVYNSRTGATVEIRDDLELEGSKTTLAWLQDEQEFIYVNDYLTVLFEAFGYFEPKQLLLADISAGQATVLIRDGYQFDVSPDKTQIAYTTGKILDSKTKTYGGQELEKFGCFQPRIYNINSRSSQPFGVRQLKEKPLCLGYPKWSPDGTKIAWMGYFDDNRFRPVIFDLQDDTAEIYDPLDQEAESSVLPTEWRFGESYADPLWVENSTFWTPSYEVNIETGETSTPREVISPYDPRRITYLESPDGSTHASLNEEGDEIIIQDTNENFLASFLLDDIYDGPRQEILLSDLFLTGGTHLAGWSPFSPSATP